MAQVTQDYLSSSPRTAETQLGWSRKAIVTGIKEIETGIVCVDNYQARVRKKTEEKVLKANDHDYDWSQSLIPFGILDLTTEQLSVYFKTSSETSDFIVDCLSMWWQNNRQNYSKLEELVINLDNGISHRSNRTQFIKRIVNFSRENQLRIRLIYYPPYHSKYNSVERCWGVLENYWNGAILDTISAALSWASNMTWKGKHPDTYLIENTYDKG
jgi:transposase